MQRGAVESPEQRANVQGVEVKETNIDIFADIIEKKLGASVSALSGANIAPEVARDKFSETTIGYRKKEEGEMWKKLFGELWLSRYTISHSFCSGGGQAHVQIHPNSEFPSFQT